MIHRFPGEIASINFFSEPSSHPRLWRTAKEEMAFLFGESKHLSPNTKSEVRLWITNRLSFAVRFLGKHFVLLKMKQ